MKYKPSRNFIKASGLLILSFFTMQGIVVPSLVRDELSAIVIKANTKVATPATTLSGVLRKQSFEEFDTKNHTITEKNVSYYLEQAGGKTIQISPKGIDENLINQSVSYNATTKGVTFGGGQAKSATSLTRLPQTKILVFLAQFANSTPVSGTAADYEDVIVGPQNGYIRKFYQEMTHNQVNFTGDVYGWYQFPENGDFYYDPGFLHECYLSTSNIQEMADFYQVDISQYDRIITISNCEEYGTIGGVTFFSNPNYNGFNSQLIRVVGHYDRLGIDHGDEYSDFPGLIWNLIHELGHTFNLSHSNSLDCGEESIASNCTNTEYGNVFDSMGGWAGRIFNFLQQKKVGWINDSNILEISGPGNYFINSLQTKNGIVGAKIYVPGIPYPVFAIEHRKATGFDSTLPSNVSNGLILYSLINPNQTTSWPLTDWGMQWRLVDAHPTNLPIFDDVSGDAISINNPYQDDVSGLTINITSINRAGINFTVNYDENSLCPQQALNPGLLRNPLCSNTPLQPAVENFQGSVVTPSQIDFSWENIPTNATSLIIQKSTNYSFNSIGNVVTLTDSLSPVATSYSAVGDFTSPIYFRIRASNSVGDVSAWTTIGSF